jgi:hypothetical protein
MVLRPASAYDADHIHHQSAKAGSIMIGLVERFPESWFVGMDLSLRLRQCRDGGKLERPQQE